MKLMTEMIEDVQCLVEKKDDSKEYYIEGIFMQAEQKNRNGRIYPMEHIMPSVDKYITEYVKQNRALGELNHPSGPTVNLDKVSHIIKELHCEGNNFMGKAKVLDTPMGKIVKNLIEEGARLGVSSRGMGSLKKSTGGLNEVQNDFILSAVDIVADPSAPDAFVNGILEGKEWIWDNGAIREAEIARYEKQIKSASRKNIEESTLNAFKDFISKL
jgi:hypothetical protein|tara:strand:- start:1802 stop:2446 length:645 start_codon:yes stop_codon:yes gene_type:complete